MTFQAGQSGNPGGKPKSETKLIAETLKRAAIAGADKLREGADKVVQEAADGNLAAWAYLRDTLDGKPAQAVTIGGDADAPPVALKATVEFINASAATESP